MKEGHRENKRVIYPSEKGQMLPKFACQIRKVPAPELKGIQENEVHPIYIAPLTVIIMKEQRQNPKVGKVKATSAMV